MNSILAKFAGKWNEFTEFSGGEQFFERDFKHTFALKKHRKCIISFTKIVKHVTVIPPLHTQQTLAMIM